MDSSTHNLGQSVSWIVTIVHALGLSQRIRFTPGTGQDDVSDWPNRGSIVLPLGPLLILPATLRAPKVSRSKPARHHGVERVSVQVVDSGCYPRQSRTLVEVAAVARGFGGERLDSHPREPLCIGSTANSSGGVDDGRKLGQKRRSRQAGEQPCRVLWGSCRRGRRGAARWGVPSPAGSTALRSLRCRTRLQQYGCVRMGKSVRRCLPAGARRVGLS